ncbi:MAG: hypothetical protein ACPHLN_08995, partial [Candidatus Puniceispirillaceae bacterium]
HVSPVHASEIQEKRVFRQLINQSDLKNIENLLQMISGRWLAGAIPAVLSCRRRHDVIAMTASSCRKPAFRFQDQGQHPDEGAIPNW